MRILLLNQFFWPDAAPTSLLLTDLARELAARGHETVAVCGNSKYAGAGSAGDLPGVEIHRTPALKFARGPIARLLSYASFLLSALWAGLIGKRPDVVVTLTTPPLISLVGTLMKKLRGCEHWIWEMDVYPDVAVELGYIKSSMLEKSIGVLTDWPRRNSDGILVLGECMKQRLSNRGIAPEKLIVAENWADGETLQPRPFPQESLLQVLYSGNLGLAHEVETVAQAAEEMDALPVADFVFAGGGPKRPRFEQRCASQNLKHVHFRGYASADALEESLASGDIGLVTQKPECIGAVVPSKVYGLMAAGRPILYVGPAGGTPHRIIEKFRCGWHINPGDVAALMNLLHTLSADRNLVYEAGRNARRAFLNHYDLPIGVSRIADRIGPRPLAPQPRQDGQRERKVRAPAAA